MSFTIITVSTFHIQLLSTISKTLQHNFIDTIWWILNPSPISQFRNILTGNCFHREVMPKLLFKGSFCLKIRVFKLKGLFFYLLFFQELPGSLFWFLSNFGKLVSSTHQIESYNLTNHVIHQAHLKAEIDRTFLPES